MEYCDYQKTLDDQLTKTSAILQDINAQIKDDEQSRAKGMSDDYQYILGV